MHITKMSIVDLVHNHLPVIEQHYAETPILHGKYELDINIEGYRTLEEAGNAVCYAVMDEEVLAGYVVMLASPSLHIQGKYVAITDAFYIKPEYRNQGIAREVFKAIEHDCLEIGIVQMRIVVNENYPQANTQATALGMTLLETTFAKDLGE